jgi:hypothetical protein
MAESFDGEIYVVDEHVEGRWLVPRYAAAIKAMLARYQYRVEDLWQFVAGDDVFARRGGEKTIAEQYLAEGIELVPADMDRVNGAAEMLARLGDVEANPPIPPRLFVFDRCRRLIECIPQMQHDPHRPEDVLKVDIDEDGVGGDDPYDSCRYGVMVRSKIGQKETGPNPPGGVSRITGLDHGKYLEQANGRSGSIS